MIKVCVITLDHFQFRLSKVTGKTLLFEDILILDPFTVSVPPHSGLKDMKKCENQGSWMHQSQKFCYNGAKQNRRDMKDNFSAKKKFDLRHSKNASKMLKATFLKLFE